MSKIVKPTSVENTNTAADAPAAVDALSSDALARRRMLLKSLSKGSAIVAATSVPIHTLAAQVTIATTENTQCIVSGMGSAIHSKTTVTGTCKGSKPASYSEITSWPGYTREDNKFVVGGITYTKDTKFRDIFGGNSLNRKLTAIMAGDFGSDVHRGWIAAWLNAGAGYEKPLGITARNFPYSPAEVVARYNNNSTGPEGNSKSYDFFNKYLQSL